MFVEAMMWCVTMIVTLDMTLLKVLPTMMIRAARSAQDWPSSQIALN